MISKNIRQAADQSVLCWLATVSASGMPNVSPKEIFTFCNNKFIIANIMSPVSEQNVHSNPSVCVSFVDILIQKGYQIKGQAEVIEQTHEKFAELNDELEKMTQGLFPIKNIISIQVRETKQILAPSYVFYPDETTEFRQIQAAKKQYNL
jgi:predicted pyridoxine 5'-phosphate oxidase superfamily flavin-nucleotide-binding protein